MPSDDAATFYESEPPMKAASEALNPKYFVPLPDQWLVAVSDIKGSTAAVAEGRHSDINFCAAAMIAALSIHCGTIPYQFGGDGAAALIPPEHADEARVILARVRSFTRREFKLELRVGLAPIEALRLRNVDVLVGHYEPSPGNAYAVFTGGGVELLETSVKERGDQKLLVLSAIDEDEDDGKPPDLTGLSCRWTPLKSTHGYMVSVVVRGPDLSELHSDLTYLVGTTTLQAANLNTLTARWPPKGMIREARARKGRGSLPGWVFRVGLEALLAYFVVRFKMRLGPFDSEQYRQEVVDNAVDFARSDDMLCLNFDCPESRYPDLESYF